MIRFHFDYLSPYAYLAWARVHDVAQSVGRDVVAVPVLFAALLEAWGQKGPAEIAPKREYVFKDALRRAHDAGVPLAPPPAHPFNPLPALRATTAIADPRDRRRAIDALFAATWGGGGGIDGIDRVARVLDDAGLDGASIAQGAQSDATKRALRDATERARAEGVFGVPTMIVDGELFWGEDALAPMARFVRGEDPLDRDALARWASLGATAVRR